MSRPENLRAKRWQIAPTIPFELKQEMAHRHWALVQTLYNRGITRKQEIDAFLDRRYLAHTDPFLLPDMDRAKELLILYAVIIVKVKQRIIAARVGVRKHGLELVIGTRTHENNFRAILQIVRFTSFQQNLLFSGNWLKSGQGSKQRKSNPQP